MPDLTTEQQTLIVTRLACYASPKEIVEELREKFALTIKANQIAYYDPLNAQGSRELAPDLKKLFWKTRDAHDKTLAKVPIAKQNVRLMLLNRIAFDDTLGKTKLGLKAVEQAAKETGGMYRPSGSSPDVDEQIERFLAELVAARQAKAPETPEGGD